MRWDDRAACRGMDQDIFFPSAGRKAEKAKAICATCPVTEECLQLALASEEPYHRHGVYGGLSAFDRDVAFDGRTRSSGRLSRNQCRNGHDYPAVVELDTAGRRMCPQCPRGQQRKTICKRNHELTGDNLLKDGKCRACKQIRNAKYRSKGAA